MRNRVGQLIVALVATLVLHTPAAAGERVYAVTASSLSIIDGASMTILSTIDLTPYGAAAGVAVAASGTRLYVTLGGTKTPFSGPSKDAVMVFDTTTATALGTIAVGSRPTAAAASPDGLRVYVANNGGGSVSVIQVSTGTVVGTITTGAGPAALAVSPDGSSLFVATASGVNVVSTSSLTVTATIPGVAGGLAVSADGTTLYMTDTAANVLSAVAISTGTTVATVDTEAKPLGVATAAGKVFATGSQAACCGANAARMMIANDLTLALSHALAVATGTFYAATNAAGSTLYVLGHVTNGSFLSNYVKRLDPVAEVAAGTATLVNGADQLFGVAVGPDDACSVVVSPAYIGVTLNGGPASLDLPVPPSCGWSVTASDPWVHVTSAANGVGPATISLSIDSAADVRSADIHVNGQIVPVFQTSPQVWLDYPGNGTVVLPVTISGWAIERSVKSPSGAALPGIAAASPIDVWAYPASGAAVLVGVTNPGNPRPDIAAAYGSQYLPAGFSLKGSGLAPGAYTLVAYFFSRATNQFSAVAANSITVTSQTMVIIDSLMPEMQVTQPFRVSGWAIDGAASAGTGVDAVNVYAYADSGAAPVFLGAAALGLTRGDLGQYFPSRFVPSGFALAGGGLAPGGYTIVAYAHSTVSGGFTPSLVHITVTGSAEPLVLESVTIQSGPVLQIIGWAIDRRAASGTGVTAIHVYAYPAGGGAPIFLGAANLGVARDDITVMFGGRYRNAGFGLKAPLARGSYTLVVYALSAATGQFDNVRVLQIFVS
jgi:YVTN family beta-propeller protein